MVPRQLSAGARDPARLFLAVPPHRIGGDAFGERPRDSEDFGCHGRCLINGGDGGPVIRFGPPFGKKERGHSPTHVVRLARLEALQLYAVNARNRQLLYDPDAQM